MFCCCKRPCCYVLRVISRVGGAGPWNGGAVNDKTSHRVVFLIELFERVRNLFGGDDLHLGVNAVAAAVVDHLGGSSRAAYEQGSLFTHLFARLYKRRSTDSYYTCFIRSAIGGERRETLARLFVTV